MSDVHVRCGVYELSLELAGRSIAELRRDLGQALSIDPQAVALVNGNRATEDRQLTAGDRVEFVRTAGQKGSIPRRRQASCTAC